MNPLDYASSSRFLCPQERYEKDKDRKETRHIIRSSYYVSDSEDKKPNYHHSLLCRNKKDGKEDDLFCWVCNINNRAIIGQTYYFCNDCKRNYHKECVESSSVFQSSHHPKHPLQLLWCDDCHWEFELYDKIPRKQCSCCNTKYGTLFYYCSICDFLIHYFCAKNPIPLTIDNSKRHEHTLQYFPRKSALVCDVCGVEKDSDYLYVCLLCDFIVHKQCVYFPYVIKTSRHDHRLVFTPYIPHKVWPNCGVCHTKINGNYGKYSCMKGCAFAMHSRCALRNDVCDGKELEGEPEEAYENLKMFEEEDDGIIRHLSHPHHQIRLEKKIQRVYGETKHCQACRLSSDDDANEYQCMQCDFILHESCAYLPRVKQFMLHAHSLILYTYTTSLFQCGTCRRYSCGFKYMCYPHYWELDTLCASIQEPFDYHSHPHQLFITCDENTWEECSICGRDALQPLNCVKCNFWVCFDCATLPHKARYEHDEHDEHLLIFSFEKDGNGEYFWCEICEEYIYPQYGFYACKKCGITLHIDCLLGRDPYIKLGKFYVGNKRIRVLPNTSSTRPLCKTCKGRCLYKTKIESVRKDLFCSIDCFKQSA